MRPARLDPAPSLDLSSGCTTRVKIVATGGGSEKTGVDYDDQNGFGDRRNRRVRVKA